MDYRSLEQKIRQVIIDESNRNTEIRRKVANVGRPDDSVKDETSKLAKQGEIKTKIVDEALDQQTDGAFMKDKDKGDKATKKKPGAQDEDDPREIKGGKTEVDLKPETNDSTEDTNKEDEVSKKAKNKVNKEIGAKGVKEQTMVKSHFGLPQSLIDSVRSVVEAKVCPKCGKNPCQCAGDPKEVDEALKGGQKKIDVNHNGKIDAQDFKILKGKKKVEEEVESVEEDVNHREFGSKGKMHPTMAKNMKVGQHADFYGHGTGDKHYGLVTKNNGTAVHVKAKNKTHKFSVSSNVSEEVEELDERDAGNKAKKNAAVAAVGAANKDEKHLTTKGTGIRGSVADKIRGREVTSGKDRMKEEVEQINELDRDGMVKRYADKARKKVEGGEESPEKRAAGRLMAGQKRWGGKGGIPTAKVPAVNREETDPGFSEAELARLEEINSSIDEVVTARKLTPADKAARAKYLAGHAAKMASHEAGADAPKKSFKDINTERGDYTKEPSKMGLRHSIGAGYYKND